MRRLGGELHLGYEEIEPWPLEEVVDGHVVSIRDPADRYSTSEDSRGLSSGEAAYRNQDPEDLYHVVKMRYGGNARKPDKSTAVVNDPDDWGKEHGDPRYIVDLVKRITRVSVETVAIVKSLPALDILNVEKPADARTEATKPGVRFE